MWKCSATLQALRKRMYKNERKQRKGDVIVMKLKENGGVRMAITKEIWRGNDNV